MKAGALVVGGRGGRQQVPVTRQPAAPASTPKGQEAPYRDPGAGALAALGRASGGGSRGRPGQGSERACLLVEPPPSRCPPSRLPLTESTGEQGPLALAYLWVTERVRLATCEQPRAIQQEASPGKDRPPLEGAPG
jgi:hypothetical protein